MHADVKPVVVKKADPVKAKKPFSVDDYPFTKCEHAVLCTMRWRLLPLQLC